MLNDNDYHYLAGFLYLAHHTENKKVILGERVMDCVTEKKRDVDIVTMRAGSITFIAAEVKNHKGPLNVTHVEQLCTKFSDMPSIEERYIVSTSGYTKTALKKAAHYQVNCLTLKRGQVPPFATIDISNVREMTILHQQWLHGPESWFVPKTVPASDEEFEITKSTEINWTTSGNPRTTTAQQAADDVARAMRGWNVPPEAGLYETHRYFPLNGDPVMTIGDKKLPITHIHARGMIQVSEECLPLDQSHYLQKSNGEIFVGSAMLEWRGNLTGVCVSANNSNLISFFLPDYLRNIRPHKIELSKAS